MKKIKSEIEISSMEEVNYYEDIHIISQSKSSILRSIQLGIKHSVDALEEKPERDHETDEYSIIEKIKFPAKGSIENNTLPHSYPDFIFKTYAPIVFRNFRDFSQIQADDFSESLCNSPLRELLNSGASGSKFYVSGDDRFIIKTLKKREVKFLKKLLPDYEKNLKEMPCSLLPKFFGLYCYQQKCKTIRFVVMNNLLPASIEFHQKYDLKGSTHNRTASKDEIQKDLPTFKDLDFKNHYPSGIFLQDKIYDALVRTINRDSNVLKSFNVMDYSFLLGVFNLDRVLKDETPILSSISKTKSAVLSTPMESIETENISSFEEYDLPLSGIPAKNDKNERLYLFVGIIDILQIFGLRKRIEHNCKSMFYKNDTFSVQEPNFYAERFQKFITDTGFKKIPSLATRMIVVQP